MSKKKSEFVRVIKKTPQHLAADAGEYDSATKPLLIFVLVILLVVSYGYFS